MVMQPSYGSGAIESTTIEMSHEGLRSLLNQIETELLDSEVYRRTMAGLQTMLGEASNTAQILVKAVGREAIRLTFQQMVRQYNVVPANPDKMNQAKSKESNSPQMAEDNPATTEPLFATNSVEEVTNSVETAQPFDFLNRPIADTKPTKKFSKAELAAQKLQQEREELLRKVGQELRQVREARSLSLQQLYNQTLVPIHHIEALEAGRINELPEDVYIRGFIRRIAQALGLNGVAMVASIPEPDPVKSVVPSWYHSASLPGFQLNSIHLYLGYTALIAGAVGGLSWMSKQAAPEMSVDPEPVPPSQSSASPKAERTQATNKPGLKSSKTGIRAGSDIAPPEALPF